MKESGVITIEPEERGVLIRGRPTIEEIELEIQKHISKLNSMGIEGAKLGELKKMYLELEFEEMHEEAIPGR